MIHDHADAHCFVKVLDGNLREVKTFINKSNVFPLKVILLFLEVRQTLRQTDRQMDIQSDARTDRHGWTDG
jgi:hypothetical protein